MRRSQNLKNPFLAFLKLIRFENLLIIALTQYFIRFGVIDSLLFFDGQKLFLQLNHFHFFLLVLSTLFIAAAGYIINDYFDVKTDRINHPETVVIDNVIKRRWAMFAHLILNFLGVSLGFWIAYKAGNFKLGFIHLLSSGLLWYYSTNFKKQLIVGNLVVAFLSAFIPLMVLLFEMPSVVTVYSVLFPNSILEFNLLYKYIFGFSLFAFLTSFIREIIKDIEDFHGDNETGCETIPIVWGKRTAKSIVIGIISNVILLLSFIVYQLLKVQPLTQVEYFQVFYIILALIFPFIILLFKLIKAQNSTDYTKLSRLVKLIMLLGINFALVIYYLGNYGI